MGNRTFKVGYTVYHGSRYWKTEGLGSGEVLGWNTRYIPYVVRQITPKRILVWHEKTETAIYLNRQTMERDRKQYHTRFHEYFYAIKPAPESKEWNWAGSRANFTVPNFRGDFLSVLGLAVPFNQADVRRAYKRLAKTAHPDLGGSHQAFIKLKQAHDSALRFASQAATE